MIPLVGVVAGTLLLRVLGALGAPWRSWRNALVPALALMYVLTGAAHFTPLGDDLARFLPPGIPNPRFLVGLAGAIQIAAGLALLAPRWRRLAAGCLIALLLIKLPLNWLGASHGLMVRGPWPTPPALRVPLVILWIVVLGWVGWGRQPRAGSGSDSTPSTS